MSTRLYSPIILRLARYAMLPMLAIGMVSSAMAADYPEPGDFASGSRVWAENCNRCHNIRDPRDLRDDQWITSTFHMRIRAGLTGGETGDILAFLQASNTVIAADSKLIACHGPDGKGALPGVPNFSHADGPLGKSNEILHQNILRGYQSPGSPMAMPPKGGNPALTGDDIDLVLRYLREVFAQE